MEFGGSSNDLLFSTKERDFSTGLDYFGFRYYDSVLGKFTTRDPSGYPDGPNNYLYCRNNPINSIDPLGLATEEEREKLDDIVKRAPSKKISDENKKIYNELGDENKDSIIERMKNRKKGESSYDAFVDGFKTEVEKVKERKARAKKQMEALQKAKALADKKKKDWEKVIEKIIEVDGKDSPLLNPDVQKAIITMTDQSHDKRRNPTARLGIHEEAAVIAKDANGKIIIIKGKTVQGESQSSIMPTFKKQKNGKWTIVDSETGKVHKDVDMVAQIHSHPGPQSPLNPTDPVDYDALPDNKVRGYIIHTPTAGIARVGVFNKSKKGIEKAISFDNMDKMREHHKK